MVEAVGVEPDISLENAQLIDSENARIGMISKIAKSTVRSPYSLFPELLEFAKLFLVLVFVCVTAPPEQF